MRFLVDVYIYEHQKINRGYIAGQLEKLDLTDFYGNIRSLALHWFGTDEEQRDIVFTPIL